MDKRNKGRIFLWGGLILLASETLMFLSAAQVKAFLETNEITLPEVGVGVPLAYFFGAVIVIGLVLFLLPVNRLRLVFKILFSFLFVWGITVLLGLLLPGEIAIGLGVVAAAVWFFFPRVWLHNSLMVCTLAAIGSSLGALFSPWTVLVLLGVLSVYDILAVRFGYMVWMAKRLSSTEALPAFVIPEQTSSWNMSLKETGFRKLDEQKPEVEVSILGGGDIGLPLVLLGSVFFSYGFVSSLIVAVFLIIGLIGAFWLQMSVLKGKPLPALPPMTAAALAGTLIVYFLIPR